MISNKILIIDTSYLLVRIYYSKTEDKLKRLSLFLDHTLKLWNKEGIYFAMDSKQNWRKEIMPIYKAQRNKKPEDYIDYYNQAILVISNWLGDKSRLICIPRYEGDDVIACIWKKNQGKDIAIYTCDQDLYQLFDPKTCFIESSFAIDGLNFNTKNYNWYKNKFDNMTSDQYLLYKAIKGDNSDNYKGVPKIGNLRACYVVKNNSLQDIELYEGNDLAILSCQRNLEIIKLNLQVAVLKYE